MKYKQQDQTKTFFEKDATNWKKKSIFSKNKLLNTITERNLYVISQIKKYKLRSLIDVGCGTGDLSYEASKFTKYSLGLDFAKSMIKLANKKFKNKNLEFIEGSLFNFETLSKFDCVSANGFIEYISLKDIENFIDISKNLLTKNGYLVFGTRNRLFNLFSLNKFSVSELKKRTYRNFFEESVHLTHLNFKKFIKLKKTKFEEVPFKQPNTGVNVDKRHQFSPLQLIDILNKKKFKIVDIHPINYHPVPPTVYRTNDNFRLFSNYIFKLNSDNKLPYIPFSSSFMISAKKK